MLEKIKFFILFFIGLLPIAAQLPGTALMPLKEVKNIYGGAQSDQANAVAKTSDGGYIIAGYTESNNGDISGNHGGQDCLVLKFNSSGILQWQKTLGGTSSDRANSILQTSDGGYIIAGDTQSNNGDASGNHGGYDCWIIKLDSTGNIQWQKMLGGTNDEYTNSIIQTTDGGYAIAGYTRSDDGDVSGRKGSYDFWIVKLNSTGLLQWQKTLGGTSDDRATSIIQTADGGYAVVGSITSNDGDVSGFHGGVDGWIVKLTGTGTLQWQKALGGTLGENINSIIRTNDGGYAVAGFARSNDGDASGNHGYDDFWVIKLTNTGTIQWQKQLGGTVLDRANAIIQTSDSGYLVAGYTRSNNGDIFGNHGTDDFWVVKLTAAGYLQSFKLLGGTSVDIANAITKINNGNYVVTGYTYSVDGDITGQNNGTADILMFELDMNGNIMYFYDDTAP
ncbi:T9SS C-terminal target domain-containing protein [Chryseobacterium sp. JJR-5R]|uniref:T9SS C-terminal target domain-containing protein n=1 Tax=Chryseobacterium sp. JJR-5R TaxID=3093923 RepID=UPI002A7588FB|nr:T9SS C-terminal target domain-containing protein [Chryseobacterium sp. JJR-5R]WPO83395.1 T9SS C-terminal target domain-containing protein [Chryseobacterium sp. JJR-5R]